MTKGTSGNKSKKIALRAIVEAAQQAAAAAAAATGTDPNGTDSTIPRRRKLLDGR
jgi:hypothetical protein